MLNKEKEIKNLYDRVEYTIDLNTAHKIVNDLIDKIKLLEGLVEETIEMPKGYEPNSWKDYKQGIQ